MKEMAPTPYDNDLTSELRGLAPGQWTERALLLRASAQGYRRAKEEDTLLRDAAEYALASFADERLSKHPQTNQAMGALEEAVRLCPS